MLRKKLHSEMLCSLSLAVMFAAVQIICATAFLSVVHAQPLPLPPASESSTAESSATSSATANPLVLIPSPVPSYIDRGVTMVPLRPIADFLGISISVHSGIITLSQYIAGSEKPTMATLRLNARAAQIANDGKLSTMTLRLPAEARLGNTFVPLRFMADVFHAEASFRVPDNAIVLRTASKIGVLTPNMPPEYKGNNAATLTLVNRIGKPLSLRLNGPQKIALELGRGQKITRRVAPGVYYYKAVCAGMGPRSGARRLSSGGRVNWIWGRG
jgi:hypothetical protein